MTGERKKLEIPKGVDDFKELRDEGYYFVDKSELISDILQNRNKVFLFTRPRRFGKSLNLSMLDAFFNIKYKGNTWFDGLKVNDHPEVEEHRNAYPVIRLSMNDLDYLDYNEFLSDFKYRIRDLYKRYRYLENSEKVDPADREDYQGIISGKANPTLLKKSLYALCSMLEQYHGIKPIILIDEYDATLNYAYNRETYDGILNIFRSFYSRALKGNESLAFAVVTGVMQIAKESIFSGLNNLEVNNIFEKQFDERYGFTESEVKELCSYYGHPEKFDEAKEWYDGYRFGNADIYNPWSVLDYIKSGFDPDTYWGGTSGNDIIDTLLQNADADTFRVLTALGGGGTIIKELTPTVAMGDLQTKPDAIYSVLAVAGYLNAVPDEDGYLLSVPNREIYKVFLEHIVNFVFDGKFPYKALLNALEAGDVNILKKELDDRYDKFASLMLVDEERYQAILAAIAFEREGRYEVSAEKESGDGRHDILMKTRYPRFPNIVIELKKADSEDNDATVDRLAHEALEQIHKKNYYRGMKGRTLLYGIVFRAKTATILLESVNL